MADRRAAEATRLLSGIARGDAGAAAVLTPLVYDELRSLGRRLLLYERPDPTLQPTALVHEAYLRLVDQTRVDWKGRTHFLAIAARQMRRVLVDHARARGAVKRGGGRARVSLEGLLSPGSIPDPEAVDVEEALLDLEKLDGRQAKIVELRFFGGLTVDEVAGALAISPKTVEKHWRMARAWLGIRLGSFREGSHRGGSQDKKRGPS